MKFGKAMEIINTVRQPKGYMVSFEKHEDGILASDHFPDLHAGEPLIPNEQTAWELARRFAKATDPDIYVNIYVIDDEFSPVRGYDEKKLNRYPVIGEVTHSAPDDRKSATTLLQRTDGKPNKNGRVYPKDIKYTNPQTGKSEPLFETLIKVYTVCCRNDNVVNGYKGCAVYITVEAENEEQAMDKAMANNKFMSHISKPKEFDRKYLQAYIPLTESYVIGKVNYYEGDERL
jgi:hypothetical protein